MSTGGVGLKWEYGDGQAAPCMGRCMGQCMEWCMGGGGDVGDKFILSF